MKRPEDLSASARKTKVDRARAGQIQDAARQNLMTDSLPVLISHIDAEQRYRFVNKTYEEWTGRSRENILGKFLWEVIGQASYEANAENVRAALSGRQVAYEREMTWPDGTTRFVEGMYLPLSGPQGSIDGFTILVTDLTERRKTEARLAASNEALKSALERESLVNLIGQAVRGVSEPQTVLRTAVSLLGQALRADRCYYVTYDQERDHGRIGTDWHRPGLPSISAEYRMSDYAYNRDAHYRAGGTSVLEDVLAMPDAPGARASAALGLRALVRAPVYHDRTMTALGVAMADSARAWTPDEVALVETVAAQTRAAVETTRNHHLNRSFLRDVLASVSEGKLRLCDTPADLPAPLTPVGKPIELSPPTGLRDLRQATHEAACAAGLPEERLHDVIIAASEVGMNAVVHAGDGIAYVFASPQGVVQVRVEDQGQGIALENLPKATLAWGFSTKATLGQGMKMMLQTVDRIFLLTGSQGTTVVLEQDRAAPLPE